MSKESSPQLSSLAAVVLTTAELPDDVPITRNNYNALLRIAKRLAGSVLSQDETPVEPGAAGE